jgi:hypothetical protein
MTHVTLLFDKRWLSIEESIAVCVIRREKFFMNYKVREIQKPSEIFFSLIFLHNLIELDELYKTALLKNFKTLFSK